ncbi:PAS domain-containing protein [Methanolobus sp. ZRKC2]|uniref:PAS domain-containing protein n=1 Tax=Methanolobus sp. ZRKC2 TaxID=3125783 RepID=UPI0032430235
MTRKGIILVVSSEWLHTMGYTAEEVIGKPFENFLRDENKDTPVKEIQSGKQNNIFHSHCEMTRKDGAIITASLSCNFNNDKSEKDDRIHCKIEIFATRIHF